MLTRRRVLQETAAAGVAMSVPGLARAAPRSRRAGQTVAVLGGGIGGLTAAHELAERGFRVTLYEASPTLGGKARSIDVPRSAEGGRRPLPGEHGARFFAGFYENLDDTMRRIPSGGNPNGAFDHLVAAPQESYARAGGRPDFNAAFYPDPRPWTLEQFRASLIGAIDIGTHLPAHEAAWFAERLIVFLSSCDARRLGEFERQSWWQFVAAERFSEEYRRVLVSSVTRFILGSKASEASARTVGLLWEAGLYNVLGRTGSDAFDRVLDGPTNEVLIDPWEALLRRLGVRFRLGTRVEGLLVRDGRIAAAEVRGPRGQRRLARADWFVLAVPVERARRLLGARARAADPRLRRLDALETRWMSGMQFYLREPLPIVRGHVLYVDSPWALSSIGQAQFWGGDFERRYGDGSARDCMSVVLGDFDEPGVVYGKPARELTPRQIAREVWEQMLAHLNDTGEAVLAPQPPATWFTDLKHRGGRLRNREPLFISTPGAWGNRPEARTRLPNLFLAADYVRVNIDTASMEGANEAGRRACNAVLDAARSGAQPAAIHSLYRPPEWEPLRVADEQRWRLGLRNALDVDPPPAPAVRALGGATSTGEGRDFAAGAA
jgi:uncharacterized protein with NAD-binding domain and iron-sulfur cluster